MAQFKDITGQRFGRLTVQYRTDDYISPSGVKSTVWHCLCDCGNECDVLRSSLSRGTQSCGCLQRELAVNSSFDLTGQKFGRLLVVKKIKLPKKLPNGTTHGWLCKCDCGNERIYTTKNLLNDKTVSCGCYLRENAKNTIAKRIKQFDGTAISKIRSGLPATKSSTTGIRGVYWNSREKKFIVKITLRRKTIYIGRYDTVQDAQQARLAAEEQYYKPIINNYLKK